MFKRFIAACCTALASLAALAGTPLLIWPIDPLIAPGQHATALWLENHGGTTAVLQVRVFDWTQSKGEDSYQPQQAVMPSPPIATIAPGGRQLVRLIATRPPAPGTEQALRIFIDELPVPDEQATDERAGTSVKLQLRYAVPLFVYGADAVPPLSRNRDGLGGLNLNAMKPVIDWDLVLDGGRPVLVLSNRGMAHARVTAVTWAVPGGEPQTVNPGLLGYVLAGSSMRFPVATALPRNATLSAQLNGMATDIKRAAD